MDNDDYYRERRSTDARRRRARDAYNMGICCIYETNVSSESRRVDYSIAISSLTASCRWSCAHSTAYSDALRNFFVAYFLQTY